MPFTPFKKGTNSHSTSGKGSPKPTPSPAGPGGQFDPFDSPGKDENGDGIYGKPVKSAKNPKSKPKGNPALNGLKNLKVGQ